MRARRIFKQSVVTDKEQKTSSGQSNTNTNGRRRSKASETSNEYTVKETTYQRRFKRSFKNDGASSSEVMESSNLKQGTNSGFLSKNKIPVSNKDEVIEKTTKTTRFSRFNKSDKKNENSYTKKEIEKIIKIQRWWRRMLAILNGYKIRESLGLKNSQGYITSQNIYTEEVISGQNENYNLYDLRNQNSRSYTNINNINKNSFQTQRFLNPSFSQNYMHPLNEINSNLNMSPDINMMSSSGMLNRHIYIQNSPRIVQSASTSPSVKNRYIIETKKVEIFRKPKNYSERRYFKESNYTNEDTANTASNYEIKHLMKDIWNYENYCSPVESLICIGDNEKSHNVSQNTMILEEYEEEINKLKKLLMKKDDELNNLMQNQKKMQININKNYRIQKDYNKNYDQDAHELQIISTKIGWNDVNVPSPVNEIFIEQIRNEPQRMQYLEGMQIMGNQKMRNMEQWTKKIKTEETISQESVSDPEAVLEIQAMNSLTIISNKTKPKNIPQHLHDFKILTKKKKKYDLEVIPKEKEPLVLQRTEQINLTSLRRKQKPRYQIQELDGLEIINRKRRNINIVKEKEIEKVEQVEPTRLRRKVFIAQNVDKICIKSLLRKKEYKNMIQELDGIEIIKAMKEPPIPQCVDELEIPREYDMLLVKPTWNSLQIQGSGLNLLSLPRDIGLENQEVDEFSILGMEKPELFIEPTEQFSYEKPNVLQKIQVLIPIPENSIEQLESFKIKGVQKPKVYIPERKEQKIVPNKISKTERFRIYGIEKEEKKVFPNKITKNDRFRIYGVEKEEKRVEPNKIDKADRFRFFGKAKEEKRVEPNKIDKADRFRFFGKAKEEKKVEPNKIDKNDRFRFFGKAKEEKKVAPNKIDKADRFRFFGKAKEEKKEIKVILNKIDKADRFRFFGKPKEEKKEIKVAPNKVDKADRFRFFGKPKEEKKVAPNKIDKNDRFRFFGKAKEEKKVIPNKVCKSERVQIDGIPFTQEQEVEVVQKVEKVEKKVTKKVVPSKISKTESIEIKGIQTEPQVKIVEKIVEKVVEKGEVKKKVTPNIIDRLDNFQIYGIEQIPQIQYIERSNSEVIEKKIVPNKISKTGSFRIYGKEKSHSPSKVLKNERFRIKGIPRKEIKVVPNKVIKLDQFELIGEGRVEVEEKVEDKVIKRKVEKKVEKKAPNKILKLDSFQLNGIDKEKQEEMEEIIEENNAVPVKRKGFAEKINRKIVRKKENSKDKLKPLELSQESTESLFIKKSYQKPEKEIVEKLIEIEKANRNWNDEIRPIKTTKLNVKGVQKVYQTETKIEKEIKVEKIEKEKEEFDIESFAFNLIDNDRKLRESSLVENGEGNKGMILKEGPAQTIKITKEKILVPTVVDKIELSGEEKEEEEEIQIGKTVQTIKRIKKNRLWRDFIKPSKCEDFTLVQTGSKVIKESTIITKYKDVKVPVQELKSVKENKLFIKGTQKKSNNWNDVNSCKKEHSLKYIHYKPVERIEVTETGEKIRTVEKIVTVEKEINWNEVNQISSMPSINILHKQKAIVQGPKESTDKNIISSQKIIKNKEVVTVYKDWKDLLKAQRNAKFALLGKAKTKKYKLFVENGDKFFIQKESDDEIIYNDDYNCRKQRATGAKKDENEKENKRQIIKEREVLKEKEIVPRLQREIKAEISRLKESESESSSVSEIDVLAGIKSKKVMGKASSSAAFGADAAVLMGYKKSGQYNDYQTKFVSGEVVFTGKNDLGVNLRGVQYQKQIYSKVGYTKKISDINSNNVMSGIEINVNPRLKKNEVYYQKMTGTNGAIGEGNYQIVDNKIVTNRSLGGSVSLKQMKVLSSSTNNRAEADLGNSSQKIIISSTNEKTSNQPDRKEQQNNSAVVILNNRRNSGSSKYSENSKRSAKIGNNELSQNMSSGQVVFNSVLKTERGHISGLMNKNKNKIISSTQRKSEIRTETNGNRNNERVVMEARKITEFKKSNRKTKNVEPLRDFDSQNSF